MKANLKVNIVFGGTINLYDTKAVNIVDGEIVHTETINRDRKIDLSNLTCEIVVNEELEDITTKEYIQAIGGIIKDTVAVMFASKKQQPPKTKE